ncbi:hypothetical protein [Acinetobacter soli]|uniref:hypothetical protein n=1 Tax=Acinetobacter soli TaxID=487316 RepID=UPI003A89BAEC
MSKLGNFLSTAFGKRNVELQTQTNASIENVNQVYENFAPYSLGTYYSKDLIQRDRKQIYTIYKIMQKDPTIDAALNLLVTAALGGHESRGEVIFISPADHIRGDGLHAKELRKMVEAESKHLQYLINSVIFAFARYGITYGDSYARTYFKDGIGLHHIICDERVEPPLIQSYEQAGITVGYHALEISEYETQYIAKLNRRQMIRMKMQRISPVPQYRMDRVYNPRTLEIDDISQTPVIPAAIGGSFLQNVESAWREVILNFTALNTQQIADSVKTAFMTIDVSGMPIDNRKKYKDSFQKALLNHHEKVKDALSGGDPIWATNWMVMPTWGDKQVMTPLGDIAQRNSPLSMELVMTHLRRAVGNLGLDISLLGWADMLAGGLGDGAAFHTSAQVMQRSALIRQAISEPLIDLIIMHFAYKYKKVFTRADLPFKIEFYSDISAAATEALNNKNTRANTLMMSTQSIAALKELKLNRESNHMLLTEYLGMDDAKADLLTTSIEDSAKKEEQLAAQQLNSSEDEALTNGDDAE